MMRRFRKTVLALSFAGAMLAAVSAQAAPRYLFKVASLAPEGTTWMKRFHDFAQEIEEKSNGAVGFKIYSGGVMGDDRAMYRKMRVGQLQAGGFTMTGIGEVVPDFRVMGVPFFFRSYEEVDLVRQRLFPRFQKAFRAKGLELLAMSEVGFVYTMSTVPVTTVADLKRTKCWAPPDDPVSQAYLKELGVTPTQLSIPDVLTSLQTGLVETVFNSFYGAIVLQWFTRTRYITDVPFGYAYGALVFDRKKFSELPPEYAALFESAAKTHFAELNQDTRQSNAEALDVLKKNGIVLVQATPQAMRELRAQRAKTVQTLVGKAFSREIYDAALNALAAFRQNQGDPSPLPESRP